MELEQQVCCRALSQKLEKLGVKQESYFFWARPTHLPDLRWVCWPFEKLSTPGGDTANWDQISAFTVAELGEMLPQSITDGGMSFLECDRIGKWEVGYVNLYEPDSTKSLICSCEADTEADARAEMLIYLLENKLIAHGVVA
jgi:hypothetical protein